MEEARDKPLFIVAGLPMYNEEETIGSVITNVIDHVDKVICVDDGSSDSSARIAESCGAIVHRHRVNRGYGGALKSLFAKAIEMDADCLVVLDSDGQHNCEDIPKLLEPILSGEADFVIGSRFIEGGGSEDMPAYRRLGIKVITAASNLSSDLAIQDTQSGFRAFSKLAIERLRFDSEGMELSLEMLEDAHEKDLKIKEVPTVIRYDVPKGRLDRRETPLQAAYRECREETGLKPKKVVAGPFQKDRLCLWIAEECADPTIGENPETGQLEHLGFKWVTPEDMMNNCLDYLQPFVKWAHEEICKLR